MTEPTAPEEPVVAAPDETSASSETAEEPAATVTEDPVVTESVTSEEPATVEEPVDDPETAVNEAASDAELRSWAKDNGIEDVPASGRLSATWREQILAAMTAALDPKDEASADATSIEPSTSTETSSTDQSTTDSTDEESPAEVEAEEPVEYRSVFQAPNTFVTSQTYTA